MASQGFTIQRTGCCVCSVRTSVRRNRAPLCPQRHNSGVNGPSQTVEKEGLGVGKHPKGSKRVETDLEPHRCILVLPESGGIFPPDH